MLTVRSLLPKFTWICSLTAIRSENKKAKHKNAQRKFLGKSNKNCNGNEHYRELQDERSSSKDFQ